MNRPDVTYVIAVRNGREFVATAIDSALRQRGVAVEVVVVDDQSTDDTAAIARGYEPRGVRVIKQPVRLGPGGARNAGIAAARGRWVGILDADDSLLPDRSRHLIDQAQRHDAQVVVDAMERFDPVTGDRGVMFDRLALESPPLMSLTDFVRGNIMFGSVPHAYGYLKPVVLRDFIIRHAVGYNDLRNGEDFYFLAQLLAHGGRCLVHPVPGYRYRTTPGSLSSRLTLDHVRALLAADHAFCAARELTDAQRSAFYERRRGLVRAERYLEFVGHVKAGSAAAALRDLRRDPGVLRDLKRPILARLERLQRRRSSPL